LHTNNHLSRQHPRGALPILEGLIRRSVAPDTNFTTSDFGKAAAKQTIAGHPWEQIELRAQESGF
jgi:hypothetical protein